MYSKCSAIVIIMIFVVVTIEVSDIVGYKLNFRHKLLVLQI